MSRPHIPNSLRRYVVNRAHRMCEYCLFPDAFGVLRYEIDHVIARKHLGRTVAENLAYACAFCNVAKGSDIGSIHWPSGEFIRFFNPRADRWLSHFRLWKSRIEGITPIGIVTARLLEFNRPSRLKERKILISGGLFPHPHE